VLVVMDGCGSEMARTEYLAILRDKIFRFLCGLIGGPVVVDVNGEEGNDRLLVSDYGCRFISAICGCKVNNFVVDYSNRWDGKFRSR